jgi:NADH-quinone oxidoreductase subunit A
MTPSEHPYAFIALYVAVAFAFPLLLLAVTWLWRAFFQPQKANAIKNNTYECGLEVTPAPPVQFKAHYYLYALLFLVFDVEVLFLLPFAAALTPQVPVTALLAMLVFILLLVEGLVWAWHRGHLEWK